MNVIIFDTETTGLTLAPSVPLSRQPRIIEFAAVIVNTETGARLYEESFLINPGELVSEEITKITGITNDQLASAPPMHVAWPKISSAFARADAVIAHNLPFDKTMIRNDYLRLPPDDESFPSLPWPEIELCTVAAYAHEFGYNPKLTELYQLKVGKKLAQTHRALDDVNALVEIFFAERLWEYLS